MPNSPRVLYISGSGRSGSTLLERMLHSAQGVASVGELHCLWRLPAQQITCSCGRPFAAEPVWQKILAAASFDAPTLEELRRLEARVCRSGFIARHGFSLASLRSDLEVRRFLALQFRLFAAIAEVSGAGLVVDSSKAGPRAWILACDPRVRVLHLHRDPADVILSWRSAKFDPGLGKAMKRMPVHAAALDWWKVDRLATTLARRRDLRRVDYRALCTNPRETIEGLLQWLDIPIAEGPQWLGRAEVLPGAQYHSLNGNPDRFDRDVLRVSPRRADWSRVGAAERPVIRLAAALLRGISAPGTQS